MQFPNTIPSALIAALEGKGYSTLTDVQSAVLAPDAQGADLLVSAQTGSGKTVGFGLAMAPELLDGGDRLGVAALPLALVIAPTRELAIQVQGELAWLFARAGGRLVSCVGGMDARAERRELARGAHIVVGTPGRLRDHIERGGLDLSSLRVAVLDEADEMLDFGFREDLEFILQSAPASRRTLMFSATVSKPIADLARQYQRDALRISTQSATGQHADITYIAHAVAGHEREDAVINVLRYHDTPRALVFCATRQAVNRLAIKLQEYGFNAVALSGELTQAERTKALQALRDGRARVCVATDVAARGIDLPGLDLVVHAEPPGNADSLLHRSGRTGRAGAKGVSVFVVAQSRKGRVIRLLRDARIEAEWTEAPDANAVRARDRERLSSHPALSADPDAERLTQARALLERFGPERIAAAFLTELEHRLPAPHELSVPAPARARDDRSRDDRGREDRGGDANRPDRAPRRDRSEFDDKAWFQVNLGREQRAEPRWLVPLICRVGGVTGADIGAIQIHERASRFQIADEKRAAFQAAMNQPRDHDANVRITLAGDEALEPARTDAPGPRAKPKRAPRPGKAERHAVKSDSVAPRPERPAARPEAAAELHTRPGRAERAGAQADRAPRTERPAAAPERPQGKPERGPGPAPGKFERSTAKLERPRKSARPGAKSKSGSGPVRDWAPKAGAAKARPGKAPSKARPESGPGLKRVKRKRTD
jgi:ATP-dependent RNA helicase DeaD